MSKASKGEAARLISVRGRVQGIGFRPVVYRLAKKLGLSGSVSNSASGALIEVSGPAASVDEFIASLSTSVPQTSKIESITVAPAKAPAEKGFRIAESSAGGGLSAEFPPDLNVCPECLAEMKDPADRRYRYPFINCTNCGPRFSIVRELPYDRPKTTMSGFRMCPDCAREYGDPADRRFHAQPVACPKCGPRVQLLDGKFKAPASGDEAVKRAVSLLKKGKILAVKGLGGYHLACDASSSAAVMTLRERKRRPHKPFAVMVPDIEAARKLCEVSEAEEELLLSHARPIVLLRKRAEEKLLAPGNACLGVMLPYTPLQYLLFDGIRTLVMTSGNRADEPICRTEAEAREKLSGITDFFLVHDREIHNRTDDSILQALADGTPTFIRRSRGFVPDPVGISGGGRPVLAVGAELKNTFTLTRGKNAYVSPYIGDLDNAEALAFFRESVIRFERFLKVKPQAVVRDLHPDYMSSVYAGPKSMPVQHHFAHIASVIAEGGLKGPVTGFAFDGLGLGLDGKVWGGECVLYRNGKFERLSHFEYFRLPGGDRATKEIWRIGVSLLRQAGVKEVPREFRGLPVKEITRMAETGVNSPECCSVGRIFDAAAAVIGLKNEVSFEAQAAMELESMALDTTVKKAYNLRIGGGPVPSAELIKQVWLDRKAGVSRKVIAAKFHLTLAEIILKLAVRYKIKDVALSGGCFQNRLLLDLSREKLENAGFRVHFNKIVPANDGGISLGQSYAFSVTNSQKVKNRNNT